jgi:hypothetical protein
VVALSLAPVPLFAWRAFTQLVSVLVWWLAVAWPPRGPWR